LIGIGTPASRPRLPGFLHQGLRHFPGAIEAQDRQGIDFAIDLGNPPLQHLEQVERRDFAGVELVDDGTRRGP
jgi:hypothetical protein